MLISWFIALHLGSVRTWRQRCVFFVAMCQQLHWWQCNPSLATCSKRQKSVSLSSSANGPLVPLPTQWRAYMRGWVTPRSNLLHFHAVYSKIWPKKLGWCPFCDWYLLLRNTGSVAATYLFKQRSNSNSLMQSLTLGWTLWPNYLNNGVADGNCEYLCSYQIYCLVIDTIRKKNYCLVSGAWPYSL